MSNSIPLKFGFICNDQLVTKFAFVPGKPSEVVVGRDSSNQIQLPIDFISKQHVQLVFDSNSNLFVIDLDSSNGTFLNDQRITSGVPYQVRNSDKLRLANQNGVFLVNNPDDYPIGHFLHDKNIETRNNFKQTNILEKFKNKNKISIGRNEENDVILAHSSISRVHASIEKRSDSEFIITDEGSTNGTFVNGKKISGHLKISPMDNIIIGRFQLTLNGIYKDLSREVAIRAERIVKQFDNGKIGLHECTLEIPSKSLLAVMGPSGCGKSTLLKALNGDAPPTSGNVYISGLELNNHYDYLKTQIGYVPQDDIVHKELTVQQALFYSAKLRLQNTNEEFIQQKINQVMDELKISHIRDNLVGKISGGQRKRVSIAVEILTDPLILFLDEPTSPLDPQTIEEFLTILRNLSNKGTTVIMVTHKPEDLNYMDSVIFMAEGGHKVYHGDHHSYLSHFKVEDTIKVYSQLAMPNALKWINQQKENHPKLGEIEISKERRTYHSANLISQFWWLTLRYFNIKLNDRLNTFILLGQAPIIAILICLIFDHISMSVPFLLAVSAVWFGTNNAAREIVGEAPIFKRERMFNQGIFPYIFSKITVLGTFAAIQSFLFTLIISINFSNTDPQWQSPFHTFLWMLFISISASLFGLFISAIVNTTEKVMTLVPIALIPQIMLAGIVAKISSPLVEFLSYFTLSRWGNEGFCIIQKNIKMEMPIVQDSISNSVSTAVKIEPTNQSNFVTKNAIEQLKNCFHDSYEDLFGLNWAYTLNLDLIIVSAISILSLSGIYLSLKRKDAIKIK